MSKGVPITKICIKCKLESTDLDKFYCASGNYKLIDNVSREMRNKCEPIFDYKSDICLDCLKKSEFPYYDFSNLVDIIKQEKAEMELRINRMKYGGYNSKEAYQKRKQFEKEIDQKFNIGFIIFIIVIFIIYKLLN